MSRTRVPLSVAVTNAFALHRSPCRSVSGPPASFRTCALRGASVSAGYNRSSRRSRIAIVLADGWRAPRGSASRPRLELQRVYATIELCQADRWHSSLGTAEECLQGVEQLSHTGLSTALQRVAKLCGVIDGQAHIATLDGPRVRPGPARAHAPR